MTLAGYLDQGIHADISDADYHSDELCSTPSLSSSVARLLLDRSPLHAWSAHPRLNPACEAVNGKRLDLGSVAHRLVIGAGAEIHVIMADSYRTKAAQEQRNEAYLAGKTPVLVDDFQAAQPLAEVASACLAAAFPGESWPHREAVTVWREDEAWCRSKLDMADAGLTTILDYKTTSGSARIEAATARLFGMGYHFQAAFYERGLNVLQPENAGRRRFVFLFQEIEAPYACQLVELDEATMTIARKQVMHAIALWRRCVADNQWPGYPAAVQRATMPAWLQQQWLNREIAEELTGDDGMPPEPERISQHQGWTP